MNPRAHIDYDLRVIDGLKVNENYLVFLTNDLIT